MLIFSVQLVKHNKVWLKKLNLNDLFSTPSVSKENCSSIFFPNVDVFITKIYMSIPPYLDKVEQHFFRDGGSSIDNIEIIIWEMYIYFP
jgi:hypothetical protein